MLSALIDAHLHQSEPSPEEAVGNVLHGKMPSICDSNKRALVEAATAGLPICVFCQLMLPAVHLYTPVGQRIRSVERQQNLGCTPNSLMCGRCTSCRVVYLVDKVFGWADTVRKPNLSIAGRTTEQTNARWQVDEEEHDREVQNEEHIM